MVGGEGMARVDPRVSPRAARCSGPGGGDASFPDRCVRKRFQVSAWIGDRLRLMLVFPRMVGVVCFDCGNRGWCLGRRWLCRWGRGVTRRVRTAGLACSAAVVRESSEVVAVTRVWVMDRV